ncbi:MAG: type III-A CRISPR-associated protein Cas10/Csm1 [Desulfurobacteriaceae bacterium]
MVEEKELKEITLSAIFHDIGKVYQRAKNLKEKHYLLSGRFIKENLKSLEDAFGSDLNWERIKRVVEKHHQKKETLIEKDLDSFIVQRADHLSSGLDRRYLEFNQEFDSNYQEILQELKETSDKKGVFEPLISIFSEVSYDGKEVLEERLFQKVGYKVSTLNFEKVYPQEDVKNTPEDYETVWNGFINELSKIKNSKDFDQKFEALKSLIVKYFWAVPSYTYHSRNIPIPDVSLADHLTTTAAIATALKLYYSEIKDRETLEKSLKDPEEKKFILMSLDFSGIQRFIFQQVKDSKKWAAKILRARSFLVSLALEGVIRKFIKEFRGNSSLVLLNAGGKALLLLPNFKDSEEKIETVRKFVARKLLKNFFGEIKIKTSFVKMSEKDFIGDNFNQKLRELFKEESKKRFQLFEKEFFKEETATFNLESFKEEDFCSICGVRKAEKQRFGVKICKLCKELVELGQNLPRIREKGISLKFGEDYEFYPLPKAIINEKEEDFTYRFTFSFDNFEGYPVRLFAGYVPLASQNIEEWKLKLLKEECFDEGDLKNYFGKYLKGEYPKNFCHIALDGLRKEHEEILGRPYLGVLKADVDKLGYIFTKGFLKTKKGKTINSLSRTVYLSRMLDFFFTEVITKKLLNSEKFKNIYSVFSGGDDLFLIGDWNSIVEFAKDLRREFRKYTGGDFTNSKGLTISIGISLFRPSTNVYAIAEEGEKALERSKKWRNAITVFGRTVRGDFKDEKFGKLLEIAEKIESWIKEGTLSTSLVYKLLEISRMANEVDENISNMLWRPRLHYLLVRNVKGGENLKKELAEKINKWIEKYSENLVEKEEDKKDDLFYIPLAIALYRRRKYGKA